MWLCRQRSSSLHHNTGLTNYIYLFIYSEARGEGERETEISHPLVYSPRFLRRGQAESGAWKVVLPKQVAGIYQPVPSKAMRPRRLEGSVELDLGLGIPIWGRCLTTGLHT